MNRTTEIQSKIIQNLEKVEGQKKELNEAISNLKSYNQRLELEIQNKNKEIERLLERIKIIKSAKSLADAGGGSAEVKYKINEMVKEIDRCISYLNK
ncbi:MAG: hypothetical protein AAF487_12710 [Bacteroidota bacterium]